MKKSYSDPFTSLKRAPALMLAFLLGAITTPCLTAQIFVTAFPSKRIEIADLDGSNHRILLDMDSVFSPSNYRPFAVTVSGNSLYWTDTNLGSIYTASLDGRNPRKLVDIEESFGWPLDSHPFDFRAFAFGFAATDSALLWAEVRWPAMGIYQADLDGSNPRLLFGSPGGYGPLGYRPNEVVVSGSRVFWTGENSDFMGRDYGKILAADLRGGNPVVLADTNRADNYGLTIFGDRLYWTSTGNDLHDPGPATIETARLDGSDVRTLINLDQIFGAGAYPWKIAAAGRSLYWVDHNLGGVFTAGLDGRNPRKLFDTFGERPDSLAVVIDPPTPPVHPFIITDLRAIPGAPPFQRLWRVTWNSRIGETYRVLLSDDMETWLPAGGTWLAEDVETQAEILLPANMPRAFFRVERE